MAQAADMTVLQINFKTVNVYSGQAKAVIIRLRKGEVYEEKNSYWGFYLQVQ